MKRLSIYASMAMIAVIIGFSACSKSPPKPITDADLKLRFIEAQERQAVAMERQAKASEDQAKASEHQADAEQRAAKANEATAAALTTKPQANRNNAGNRQAAAMERSARAAEQRNVDEANTHMFDSLKGWPAQP